VKKSGSTLCYRFLLSTRQPSTNTFKTDLLCHAFAAMQKRSAEARKIIKLDIPQPFWLEFGIDDKR
jgi:hypothetical protein